PTRVFGPDREKKFNDIGIRVGITEKGRRSFTYQSDAVVNAVGSSVDAAGTSQNIENADDSTAQLAVNTSPYHLTIDSALRGHDQRFDHLVQVLWQWLADGRSLDGIHASAVVLVDDVERYPKGRFVLGAKFYYLRDPA